MFFSVSTVRYKFVPLVECTKLRFTNNDKFLIQTQVTTFSYTRIWLASFQNFPSDGVGYI